MYGNDKKKLLILVILKVLQHYTDTEHHLTQQKILYILRTEYGITCDRRSVKSNIMDLIEMGYDINMDNGYYLASRDFEPAELRMLIDSVLFSRHISLNQRKRLIDNLIAQGNKHFKAKVSHVSALPDLSHTDNKHIMLVIDTLNDAIDEKKKVEFVYNSYGTDFKLHPRPHSPYLVSPYQMVASNGRYYLLANSERYPDITYFRIDRITDIKIMTDIPIKPIKEINGMANGFNLPRHMAEHTYMFCGESVRIQLKTTKAMMNDLIDWFGMDFKIVKEIDDDIIVSVTCNYNAMFYWALQYGSYVEVLTPQKLREELKDTICKMYERYTVTRS